jgi:hypothetical protein
MNLHAQNMYIEVIIFSSSSADSKRVSDYWGNDKGHERKLEILNISTLQTTVFFNCRFDDEHVVARSDVQVNQQSTGVPSPDSFSSDGLQPQRP